MTRFASFLVLAVALGGCKPAESTTADYREAVTPVVTLMQRNREERNRILANGQETALARLTKLQEIDKSENDQIKIYLDRMEGLGEHSFSPELKTRFMDTTKAIIKSGDSRIKVVDEIIARGNEEEALVNIRSNYYETRMALLEQLMFYIESFEFHGR